ncbi:M23 family metallopeptidase [Streptomyces palmae]|uniref:M23 family metallopeptidase n=1 Tax=Streptomyces palmae TaxID=1701085 RepID=A0A4Z0GB32_9ACTN|nr:M23 family metallopeptidase [Streptomyces palmae]TGA91595.1 M23 family metallopeptidase [Streptomyces palmae]
MNDRHPSGPQSPTDHAPDASHSPYYGEAGEQQGASQSHAGYDGYSTGTFSGLGTAYGEDNPLYGGYGSQDTGQYGFGYPGGGTAQAGGFAGEFDTGQYATTASYADGAYSGMNSSGTGQFTVDAYGTGQFETGAYPTGQFETGQFPTGQFETGSHETGLHGTASYADSGQWDLGFAQQSGLQDTGSFTTSGYGDGGTDTGGYDTSGLWGDPARQPGVSIPAQQTTEATGQWDSVGRWDAPAEWDTRQWAEDTSWQGSTAQRTEGVDTGLTQTWDTTAWATGDSVYEQRSPDPDPAPSAEDADRTPDLDDLDLPYAAAEPGPGETPGVDDADTDTDTDTADDHDKEPVLVGAAVGGGGGSREDGARARRRTGASRPKRSALLTVAVPSVAIMGVTAVAAAAVGMGNDGKQDNSTNQAAPDTGAVKASVANRKLDTQLAGLSDRADDFANRASRTQERIDLKARQEAERKRKIEEARRKEALRPKFALPVSQHGLSATFGQAGLNWMSVHTGIDFPVDEGTPVMAATDGTVTTKFNSAYGNMAIVTSPDGTQTWYCHLSSTRIRSGSVKAGDVIAYSGNTGNSTGPHLHFEVRPGGGSAIDPLTWLRSHGVDPT